MLEITWNNFIENLFVSPLIKHQTIFAFICRKYYISKLLAEVSPSKNENSESTYSQTQKCKSKLIEINIKHCKKFDLIITEQHKTLPIMYWLPKMHDIPIGARFRVASKNYSTKLLCDLMISKVFKIIFNHVEVFMDKIYFSTHLFPIDTKLDKIHTKKKAKSISTFDFTTLYMTVPHNLLIKVSSEVTNFAFKSKS